MSLGFNLGQTGNASAVGAGIVKLATQTQVDNKDPDDGGVPLVVTPDKIPSGSSASPFLAGEAIAAGDAVALAQTGWTEVPDDQLLDDQQTNIKAVWKAQEIQVPADALTLKEMILKLNIASTDFIRVRITSDLTASPADTFYSANLAENKNGLRTFTISNIDVSAYQGQKIYIKIGTDVITNNHYVYTQSTAPYANGSVYGATSELGTYSLEGTQYSFYFEMTYGAGDDNEVVKCSSALFNSVLNFVGFAKAAAVDGASVEIDLSTVTKSHGLTLTPGQDYYLTDTPGVISTTPGTINRLVGYAQDASTLVRARGPVSSVYTITSSSKSPVTGHFTCTANGGNHSPSVNGKTFSNSDGNSFPVRRGWAFSANGSVGGIIIIDYAEGLV